MYVNMRLICLDVMTTKNDNKYAKLMLWKNHAGSAMKCSVLVSGWEIFSIGIGYLEL